MIYLDNAATTIKKPDAVYDAAVSYTHLDVYKRQVFRYELMQEELGTAADAVVDDSIIDTRRQVYVRKRRDSGFEGRVACVFANERGWF